MSDSSGGSAGGGIGFAGAIFIVFLVLKLCGVIDWNWVWITCPLWIPLALGLAICLVFLGVIVVPLLVAAIAFGIAALAEKISRKKK